MSEGPQDGETQPIQPEGTRAMPSPWSEVGGPPGPPSGPGEYTVPQAPGYPSASGYPPAPGHYPPGQYPATPYPGYGPPVAAASRVQAIVALVVNILLVLATCGAALPSLAGLVVAAIAIATADSDPRQARTLLKWAWGLAIATVVLGILLASLVASVFSLE